MTFDLDFVQITAKGHLGGGASTIVDRWMITLKVAPIDAPATVVPLLPAFLNAIAPAFTTFHTAAQVTAGTDAWLTELNAAVIGPDGKYTGGGTQATTVKLLTATSGLGAAGLPWSSACCYTLVTNRVRGRASKGRFYYPALGTAVGGGLGTWSTTTVGGRATAAKALIDSINTAAKPALGSTAGVFVLSKVGAGVSSRVIQVKVGRVPDRQERREGVLQEEYSAANIA